MRTPEEMALVTLKRYFEYWSDPMKDDYAKDLAAWRDEIRDGCTDDTVVEWSECSLKARAEAAEAERDTLQKEHKSLNESYSAVVSQWRAVSEERDTLRAENKALRKQLDYSNDWITRLVILGDEAGHQKKRNDTLLRAKGGE